MMLNNDRLSHWLIGAGLAWIVYFVLFGIPVFHLLLAVPISKISACFAVLAGVHMAGTPWLFSARATKPNPAGQPMKLRRTIYILGCLSAEILFWFVFKLPPDRVGRAVFVAAPIVGCAAAFAIAVTVEKRKAVQR
jgi:hypothetical protein